MEVEPAMAVDKFLISAQKTLCILLLAEPLSKLETTDQVA